MDRLRYALLFAIAVRASALMHDPAVSRTHVAFVHGGQVWIVQRSGGTAQPLTSTPGVKSRPRFSPDGSRVAFGSNESRNMVNIFTISRAGGTPLRITYLPSEQVLTQWTADDRLIFSTNALSFSRIEMQLFIVGASGGLPQKLPLVYGAEGALDATGRWLAYTPQWPNMLIRRWKGYRGGSAPDIRLLDLKSGTSTALTDHPGSDTQPMWAGRTIYYLSDAGDDGRMNVWSYDLDSKTRRQWTHFRDLDVCEASIGPGAIVFRHGSALHLLDLTTGVEHSLPIRLPAAEKLAREVDASRFITNRQLAGTTMLVEARGDLWTGTAAGALRNLTATSGVFEREAALSPDGSKLAYSSDASGEYQVYVRDLASGNVVQVTDTPNSFRYRPVWSRDNEHLAFADQSGTLFIADVATRSIKTVDRDAYGETPQAAWSNDSRWLAYTLTAPNRLGRIWRYDLATGARRPLTSDRYGAAAPVFSRDHLFFISFRNFSNSVNDWLTQRIAYRAHATLMAVPLADAGDDFERVAFRLKTTAGNITALEASANGNPVYGLTDLAGASSVRSYDLATQKERVITGDAEFALSSDGMHLLVMRDGHAFLRTLDDEKETAVDAAMPMRIDLRDEWRELFDDAWRRYRDFFYAPKPLADWNGVRARYRPLIEACVTRDEVNLVLASMIGESGVGHAYLGSPGDIALPPAGSTGMLGADFAIDAGAFRITRIYEGAATDDLARSPLRGVAAGEYLLAVDGKPLSPSIDPRSAFAGRAGQQVTLTVGPHPAIDAASRTITVTPLGSENELRYRAWVEENRQYVERVSGGRVGYLHVPDFGVNGFGELVRQFAGEIAKEALIIDARWSQGGWVGAMAAELLDRPLLNSAANNPHATPWPALRFGAHFGRKALLVNHITVSAGENFSWYFRMLHLGPIIGTRTWGGFTGLNGTPALIDGGSVNVPDAPFFDAEGHTYEGVGIEPDVVVPRDPASTVDAQLEAAVRQFQ